MVAAAASIAAPFCAQEPPETAGDDEEEEAGAGACDGGWTLLLPLVLAADEPELLEFDPVLEDWVAALPVLVELWLWNDLAAATEMTPVSATAPAMSQRLIRRISAKPASLALTGPLRTTSIIARRQKKTLSRR